MKSREEEFRQQKTEMLRRNKLLEKLRLEKPELNNLTKRRIEKERNK